MAFVFPERGTPSFSGLAPEQARSQSELPRANIRYYYQWAPQIERLPPELLLEILVLVVPFEISQKSNLALLRLTWVSTRWRAILRTLRSLWSSLAIKVPINLGAELTLRMVDEWVQRSGNHPLSFSLSESFACRFEGTSCHFCVRIYERVFLKYSERIHHVEGLTPHLFHAFCKGPFQSLRSLVFDIPRQRVDKFSMILFRRLIPFASNVHRLRLHGVTLNPRNVALVPRLSQLTHLSIHQVVGLKAWLQIMTTFTNLEAVVVYYYSRHSQHLSEPELSTISTVTLPRLTSLTVMYISPTPMDLRIFFSLEMPRLKNLRIGSSLPHRFSVLPLAEETMQIIYQRLRSVRHLALIFNHISGPDTLNLLINLLHLEHLDLQDCTDFQELIYEFREFQERSLVPFLPSLRKITFDIRHKIFDEITASLLRLNDSPFELTNFRLDLTAFALKRLPNSDEEQDLPQNALHIKFYLSGEALLFYPLFSTEVYFDARHLTRSFVFWDEDFGGLENRWEYRLEDEDGPIH